MTPSGKPLALIIDDEADIRDMAELALRNEGWEVATSENGRAGLRIVEERIPDLIIVDLMMTEMNGLEFCHRLIDRYKVQNVPVLMISGVSQRAKLLDDFWNLPLRYKDFMHKPFDVKQLMEGVKKIVPPAIVRQQPQAPSKPKATAPPSAARPQPRPATPPPPSRPAPPRSETKPKASPASPPEEPSERKPIPLGDQSGEPKPPAPKVPEPKAKPEEPTPEVAAREPEKPATAQPTAAPSAERPQPPQPPPAAPQPTPKPVEHKRGYRVLAIDDDPDILMILQMSLGAYHTMETAPNGMEGIRALDDFEPDFIITDINMPVMNGLETAAAIRRHPRFHAIPIFFLTGESDRDLPRKSFEVGGNLYLRKPVNADQLVRYIDYFIEETKLEPNRYRTEKRAESPTPTDDSATVRLLTVDFNIENHRLIKRLLGEEAETEGVVETGPLETLWSEDPREALGNLTRWEPDAILYNPRNPVYDGTAFAQMLRLHKQLPQIEMAFIGTRFYDADLNYSRKTLGRGVIPLDGPEQTVAEKLGELLKAARTKRRPKKLSIQKLHEEEVEQLREQQAHSAKAARQRDIWRKRYTEIQQFIDNTFQ